MKSLGLYIHIPFCVRKCNYCDFCSFPSASEETREAYVRELARRMAAYAPQYKGRTVDTVYFGGGTPTLLSGEQMGLLMQTVKRDWLLAEDCEITCECNPATADRKTLQAFRKMGINRLSIGLQSTHPNELKELGRVHDYESFLETYRDARAVGFENISVDLMYAIPNQTLESFKKTLERVVALGPEHVSAYGLKIEEGTPFAERRDTLVLPDEDTEYRMYCLCVEMLERAGYRQYEISNFSLKGKESRHNLRYWKGEEYLGLGVAAYSFLEGERFGNSEDLRAFLAGREIVSERERLTERDRNNEYLMLGLRLTEGVSRKEIERRFGQTPETLFPDFARLIKEGFLRERDGRISFTPKGFFVSNTVLAEILEL